MIRSKSLSRILIVSMVLVAGIVHAQTNEEKFEKRQYTSKVTLPYRLCRPDGYNTTQKYPLVLALHGYGEIGTDNEAQIKANRLAAVWADSANQKKWPCFVVAPQFPSTSWQFEGQDKDNRLTVMDLLDSLITEFPVDTNRLYVTGLSMGGYTTWDLITEYPDKFAAAIPVCGGGDPGQGGGDPGQVSRFAHLPIWVFHGEKDPIISVSKARDMVTALERLGRHVVYTYGTGENPVRMTDEDIKTEIDAGADLLYTEWPGQGHEIWDESYDYPLLLPWFFSQKKTGTAPLTLTSPNGGESWTVGSIKNITWTSSRVTDVKLEYTTNNGTNWTQIIASTAASTGSYAWTVPSVSSAQYLVRITDTTNLNMWDVSDGVFSITSTPPTTSITVTAPNGGESWTAGTTHNITWTSTGVANVKLEYSLNNGSTWLTIITSRAASSGTYVWAIPAVTSVSAQCLVQVSDAANSALNDVSNGVFTIQSYLPKMVSIANGTFQMGSTTGDVYEQPVHTVTINITDLRVSATEVTQAQYTSVMGSNPSSFTGDDNLPVEMVTWWDAVSFCNKLSTKAGLSKCYDESSGSCDYEKNGFRLPTEAEWEYACHAGTTTNFYLGDEESDLASAGWYSGNSGGNTHPVGQKTPNAWGLYDMHGNVFEWCNDWFGTYSSGSATNPTGANSGSGRVIRGGGVFHPPWGCRSTLRYSEQPLGKSGVFGFRIVRGAHATAALILTSPNGGESWTAGTVQNITWTSTGVSNVKLEFTTNGSTWMAIALGFDAARGKYLWTVPNTPSTQCLVRVSDASNTTMSDVSNVVFRILPVLLPPSNLTVSDVPNDQGHRLRLTWTASASEKEGLVSGYRIYRSRTSVFTDPLPLSRFSVLDSLIFYEQRYTILIDSVSVGKTEYIDSSVPLNGVPYYYWVQAIGKVGASKPVISSTATAVEEVAQTPQEFKLGEVYPNPFNPSATIEYSLPKEVQITLEIYNISGQKIATVDSGRKNAGKHTVVWDARGLPSGVYFYTLRAGEYVKTGKALLMK